MMRDMVHSMKSLVTRREAKRRKVITNLANTTTTSPKRAHTKRDLIMKMIMAIRKKVDTMNIMDTKKNMARKEDPTTIRNGDMHRRKAEEAEAAAAVVVDMDTGAIKSLNMNLSIVMLRLFFIYKNPLKLL